MILDAHLAQILNLFICFSFFRRNNETRASRREASPNVLLLLVTFGEVFNFSLRCCDFFKGRHLYEQSHYMPVDVRWGASTVHKQSLQAVTLEVASEGGNTSLAQPKWDAVAKPEILQSCLGFQVDRFPEFLFFSPYKDIYKLITQPTKYIHRSASALKSDIVKVPKTAMTH